MQLAKEKLEKENVAMRKEIEDEAWEMIDQLKDKNKDDLAQIITDGMKAKSELTTVHGERRKKEEEKRQLDEKRKEAENRLK